jgi:predicted kinase
MAEPTYSQEQVTKALLALAANAGDAKLTAEQLQEGDFMVTEATLLLWRHEEHRERYERFARELAYDRESRVVGLLQETLVETSRIKRDLLPQVEKSATRPELAGHALRAVTDAESKSTSSLLALTGRPTDGRREVGAEAMVRLVEGLAAKGLVNVAGGLVLESPRRVPNEATEQE